MERIAHDLSPLSGSSVLPCCGFVMRVGRMSRLPHQSGLVEYEKLRIFEAVLCTAGLLSGACLRVGPGFPSVRSGISLSPTGGPSLHPDGQMAKVKQRLGVHSDIQRWNSREGIVPASNRQATVSLKSGRSGLKMAPAAKETRLTGRELVVLGLLGDGLTAAVIGRRLGISTRTVHKHLEHVYSKLGTGDRLTTVLRAQRSGLLTQGSPSVPSRI